MIYTHHIDALAAFYARHFGYVVQRDPADRLVELLPGPAGGAALMLHPAAKPQKMGQVLVKLVFDVDDVETFCKTAAQAGLHFGKIHRAEGYVFANAKDPSGNAVQISSRAFRN